MKLIKLKLTLSILTFINFLPIKSQNYLYNGGVNWTPTYFNALVTSNPSAFKDVVFEKVDTALMWDRDANSGNGAWTEPLCWIYRLNYTDNISAEIRIRQSGFTQSESDNLALKYAEKVGQLPYCLRVGTKLINILKSDALFGGNNWNGSMDITIGATSQLYENTGNLEETLFHEATHAALDYLYNTDYKASRDADAVFISKYAADNPDREDISETFLVWLMLINKSEIIPSDHSEAITQYLSNRLNYFNSLNLNVYPFSANTLSSDSYEQSNSLISQNPVTDKIIINKDYNQKKYSIYNTLGKQVKKGKIEDGIIEFKNYDTGVYFLKIENKKAVRVIKE